ncbi:ABC transporter permease subunit [Acetomicrobium sp.]|uniref:ABC transporter permease n=1 Tax=Acetomicrobium sp. TaxID=1872099 RepID=UPI002FCB186E
MILYERLTFRVPQGINRSIRKQAIHADSFDRSYNGAIFFIHSFGSIKRTTVSERGIFVFKFIFLVRWGLPSFLFFISFFGPLLGIILGFDAINGERTRGTLSLILSQPVYRDVIINGKFLASIATVAIMIASIMVMIAGISIAKLGAVPNGQEVARAFLFFIACILYIAFWTSLAILFSIVFEKSSTSALTSIAIWIFLAFFVYMIAGVIADEVYPITRQSTPELLAKHESLRTMLLRFSPAVLLEEISAAILNPTVRVFGPMFETQLQGLILTPLSLGQSMLVVWPQFVALVAASIICFAVSYLAFMRKEIRST